jgi:hypothetical protein
VTWFAEGTDSSSVFLQYGAVGATTIIFIGIAWTLFKKFEETLKFEREGRKRAEDELRESNAYLRDKVVPALEQATTVMAQFLRASRRDGRDYDDAPR